MKFSVIALLICVAFADSDAGGDKEPAITSNTEGSAEGEETKKDPEAEWVLKYVWDAENQDFFERGARAVRHIFQTIDVNNDNLWSVEEIKNFGNITNGVPFTDEGAEEAIASHQSEDGAMSWLGFASMYMSQTSTSPGETAKDLRKFGYDDMLGNVEKFFYVNGTGFTDAAKVAFGDVFDQFDNDNNSHWSPQEFSSFTAVSNNDGGFPLEACAEFMQNFFVSEDKELTRLGFFQYMLWQGRDHPRELYADMAKFQYDQEFRNINVLFRTNNNSYSEKGLHLIRQIFDYLDLDKDSQLNMTEIDTFGSITNGRVWTEEEHEIWCQTYECEEGKLTWLGFLQFIGTQCHSDPNETWKDLRRFGFNHLLVNVAALAAGKAEIDAPQFSEGWSTGGMGSMGSTDPMVLAISEKEQAEWRVKTYKQTLVELKGRIAALAEGKPDPMIARREEEKKVAEEYNLQQQEQQQEPTEPAELLKFLSDEVAKVDAQLKGAIFQLAQAVSNLNIAQQLQEPQQQQQPEQQEQPNKSEL